jgi:hypothetical protein
VQAKDDAREAFESGIRAMVRRRQISPDVSDEERALLGITVASGPSAPPAGGPTARPVGTVDTSERLRHTIAFRNEATPTSQAKPQGVMGCEIWVKIGDPAPTDPSQLEFLALDTSTPYVADYPGTAGGQTAHYMLRWVTTQGAKGPWSETVSATIGA